MHQIEPFYVWNKYYDSSKDERSPFYEKEYDYSSYHDTSYGYYIDPSWDFCGSETLYIKLLYVDYTSQAAIIEFLGEWNDALHNDVMHFKRNIVDHLLREGISRYILIGENVFNFHGSDDCYYEEWFDETEEGWIMALGFQDHVVSEWKNFNIDAYLHYGGDLDILNWRTKKPKALVEFVNHVVSRRIPSL